MVTFITLYLALVAGIQTAEFAVDGPVTKVELFLDQQPVGAVEGPPWRIRFDFGPDCRRTRWRPSPLMPPAANSVAPGRW